MVSFGQMPGICGVNHTSHGQSCPLYLLTGSRITTYLLTIWRRRATSVSSPIPCRSSWRPSYTIPESWRTLSASASPNQPPSRYVGWHGLLLVGQCITSDGDEQISSTSSTRTLNDKLNKKFGTFYTCLNVYIPCVLMQWNIGPPVKL